MYFFVNVEYSLQTDQQHTHTHALMHAEGGGDDDGWQVRGVAGARTRPRGLALGVSSSGSSHHSALDTDQSHKSILARA